MSKSGVIRNIIITLISNTILCLTSPCPDVFTQVPDNSGIIMPTENSSQGKSITLNVIMTKNSSLFGGKLELEIPREILIEHITTNQPLRYEVQFPNLNQAADVTKIRFSSRSMCEENRTDFKPLNMMSNIKFGGQRSPCPDIFTYVPDDNGWHGVIVVNDPQLLGNTITLEVILTSSSPLIGGKLEPDMPNDMPLENISTDKSLKYKVHFPNPNHIPTVAQIMLNGRSICEEHSTDSNVLRLTRTIKLKEEYSPCPDVFTYESNNGGWHGIIMARNPPPFGEPLVLNVSLSSNAKLSGGRLELDVPRQIVVDYIRTKQSLRYKVHFPDPNHPPDVNRIAFNGKIICERPTTKRNVLFLTSNIKASSRYSKCPFVFTYVPDSKGWHGIIVINKPSTLDNSIRLDLTLTSTAPLIGGKLESEVPEEMLFDHIRANKSLKYKVHFPEGFHPPYVGRILFNGKSICEGNSTDSNRLVLSSHMNVGSQLSPCPDVFTYVPNDEGWHGIVVVSSLPPLGDTFELTVKLSSNTPMVGGKLDVDTPREMLVDYIKTKQSLRYKVNFPESKKVPIVAQILFNGKSICKGGSTNSNILTLISNINIAKQYSPCPDVFSYVPDKDGWHGIIEAPNPTSSGNQLKLSVKMSIAGKLNSPFVGKIDLAEDRSKVVNRIMNGDPVFYRVTFPAIFPLPKIVEIIFNNKVICTGSPASNAGLLTSVDLQHALKYKRM